ncbi:prepilin-type N-terminal cleavage/methylation domain-containing protein [Patescibacteria group bacterium]|nr:prepilin-type N-terminal cleavage/methylation domain-containing protein [Patescibacteria group bacterium]MBU1123128.1 prepilin-type N-terminal cleavage/methylation domain-containing protein [Patescibacteria group bacterium]MBU1911046.1 prepilin-type N-terminal cleavage/methylation domain-containing protein [Patescibacteria group bacterium]
MQLRTAFSLPEVLITLAVIAAISAVAIPTYRSYQIRNDLELAAQQITQMLARAQLLSQAGSELGKWGVSASNGTIFLGDSYESRNPLFDEGQSLPTSINVIGNNEVKFSPVYGEPSITGVIILEATNGNRKEVPIPKFLGGASEISFGNDVKVRIDFEYIKNQGKGSAEAKSFVGEDAVMYEDGEWIPIKVDGIIHFDSNLDEEVRGLSVQRGNGFIRILGYAGLLDDPTGKEIIDARITFQGASVIDVVNDTGKNETENPFDGNVNSGVGGDEVTWTEGSRSVFFQTRETNYGDGILIYWESDPIRL